MTDHVIPNVEDVIGKYVALRAEKQAKDAEHKAMIKTYDDRLKKLEAWLHLKMTADGVKAFNTDAGTAYTTTVEQATVKDMHALLDYIRENETWHLLEKRVSKTGIREILDSGLPLPPGIDWYTTTSINVRKPSER